MAFVPDKWADGPAGGTPITAAELNRIEAAGAAVADADVSWGDVTGKPSTFPAADHDHDTDDITGLSAALAGKADQSALNALVARIEALETKVEALEEPDPGD